MQKLIHKALESETRLLNADEAALTLVRKHAQREVTADDVFLGRMCLSSTAPDIRHECFTKAHLERFRDTIIGASLMEGHDYKKKPLGRFYDASVEPAGNEHRLMASFYINRKNEQLVSDIELGIQKHSSIGAYVADAFICNLCNLDYSGSKSDDGRQCIHQAGKQYEGQRCTVTYAGDLADYRAVEGSLVFLGANPDAALTTMAAVHAAKEALLAAGLATEQGEDMELQQALKRIEELEGQLKQAGADAALVADGKAYREHLNQEITRIAGLVGKTDTYGVVLKNMHASGSDSLLPIHQELVKEFEIKFPPQPVGKMGDFKREEQQAKPAVFNPARRMALPVGGK